MGKNKPKAQVVSVGVAVEKAASSNKPTQPKPSKSN